MVQIERRSRARYGLFVMWHQPESAYLGPEVLRYRHAAVPAWWADHFEVPQGFFAPLGPALAYTMDIVREDMRSGWWVVILTEFAANVAAFLVWEACDSFRLWWLPPKLIRGIRRLDTRQLLGEVGHGILTDLLREIESTNWAAVSPHQQSRMRTAALPSGLWPSPGRDTRAGDWVWYEVAQRFQVTERNAKECREIPGYHHALATADQPPPT